MTGRPLHVDDLMLVAVAHARRGLGSTRPNPCVGAVVARGATVLGRYVIDRCLRRERLASVYAARDQSGLWVSVWAARRDQITRGADS
ncbi:MAG TPA: hypothetical protein PKA64_15010, partial [Myxococcota bacterium]|nr:hypothetical protein [Myxococcota bacterium]